MPTERLKNIDIAKGIAILLVIVGHQIDYFGFRWQGIYDFVYLFHVPLFFFISGLFFKKSEGLLACLKQKFIRLYLPFLFANAFFFAIEMGRAAYLGDAYDGSLGWKDLFYALFGLYPVLSMLARPTWFLLILFRVFILYKLFQIIARDNVWIISIVCIALGTVGVVFRTDAFMIGQTCSALPFFWLGSFVGTDGVRKCSVLNTPLWTSAAFLVSVSGLVIISNYQRTNMAVNSYGNLPLFITGALIGILAVLCLSNLVQNCRFTSSLFSFIGKHTLSILIWHVFIIKVVYTVLGQSANAFMFVIELVTAVVVPCSLGYLYEKLKCKNCHGLR